MAAMRSVRHISLGLMSFHYWYESPQLRELLDGKLLEMCNRGSIQGVELGASHLELERWAARLRSDRHALPEPFSFSPGCRRALLELPRNTLHLPDLSSIDPTDFCGFCERIRRIFEYTEIAEVTAHPSSCDLGHFEQLLEVWPSEVALSIENMDPRAANCQDIEELLKFLSASPAVKLTFDLCHWLELGRGLAGAALLRHTELLQRKLSKIHFSSPLRSEAYCDYPEISTHHYLMAPTSTILPRDFLGALPLATLWVLEGVVPPGRIDLLEREAELLRGLPSGALSAQMELYDFLGALAVK